MSIRESLLKDIDAVTNKKHLSRSTFLFFTDIMNHMNIVKNIHKEKQVLKFL